MPNKNQVAPEEIGREASQHLNDLEDLKKNLIIKDDQLILKDEFYIFAKEGVSYNGKSALWYLLYDADINQFLNLINTVFETVNALEAVELTQIQRNIESSIKTSPIKDRIKLTPWFIKLMVNSPCGTSTKFEYGYFSWTCFNYAPITSSLIEDVLSKKSVINRHKFTFLMQLIIGYRTNDENASAWNEFLKYFYCQSNQYSSIEGYELDSNHSEILCKTLSDSGCTDEVADLLASVITFIKSSIPSDLKTVDTNDHFSKLITIVDFVLLEKRDDLIRFNNNDSQNNQSIESLDRVNRIYNKLSLNRPVDQLGKVVPMVPIHR